MRPDETLGTRRYIKFAAGIRRRDRYTCQVCGSTDHPQVDHIVPRHLGGRLMDPHNVRVLCRICNLIKGGSGMTDAEILAARRLRRDTPPRTRPMAPSRRPYGSAGVRPWR